MVLPTIQDIREMAKETQQDFARLDLEVKEDAHILKDDLRKANHARLRCSMNRFCIINPSWNIEDQPDLWDEEIFRSMRSLVRMQESLAKLKATLPLLHKKATGEDLNYASAMEVMELRFDMRGLKRRLTERLSELVAGLDSLPDHPSQLISQLTADRFSGK